MEFQPEALTAFAGQVHGASLLLGIFLGAGLVGIILLVVSNRLQRRHLLLSLRMEQAGKNNRRLEEEAHQLYRNSDALQQR
jgi:hypothetical protein